jgi:serine/threonine-protein phosphatase 2A activator
LVFPITYLSKPLDDPSLEPASILLPPPLPPTNLYNLCINRLHALKHGGAFHEHSPQLYSIAVGVPPRTTSSGPDGTVIVNGGWKKVNVGMMKMYVAEVLGKRVVVQHTPLGGLLEWDRVDPDDRNGSLSRPANLNPVLVVNTGVETPSQQA